MFELDPQSIRDWYHPERRLLFITGAGISVDSGLPTYRGVAGLYDNANTEDGIPIENALSGSMFRRRPEITWKYLMQIANACKGKSCNRGHVIISELQEQFEETWVLTQNIDGFHRDAGSRNVIEIHGTMRRLRCTSCTHVVQTSVVDNQHIPPICQCGESMRPDVVLFDEMLPDEAVQTLQTELNKGFDAIFVVGTSALFPYIANPIYLARQTDCVTVEINPGQTELSHVVDFKLSTEATPGLEQIQSLVAQAC